MVWDGVPALDELLDDDLKQDGSSSSLGLLLDIVENYSVMMEGPN